MEAKIENQEQYEKTINYFEVKYFNEYETTKKDAINLNAFYIKKINEYNSKINFLQGKFPINQALIFIQEWGFNNNSKKNLKTEFEIVTFFCEKNKYSLQSIARALAEFHSVKKVFGNILNERARQDQDATKKPQDETDTLYSTIENKFNVFKETFNNEKDYFKAVTCLKTFFVSGQTSITETLFVKNGNIKSMCFALGEIWRTQKNEPITYEYLSLYKELFSIFKNQKIEKKNIFGCNLYKYSISKT